MFQWFVCRSILPNLPSAGEVRIVESAMVPKEPITRDAVFVATHGDGQMAKLREPVPVFPIEQVGREDIIEC